MKIEVFASTSPKTPTWYWHVVARNGRIVSDSEGYTSFKDAKRAAVNFIKGVCKVVAPAFNLDPMFRESKPDRRGYVTIRWS